MPCLLVYLSTYLLISPSTASKGNTVGLIIFPAIDLRQGQVVRLRQGDPAAQTVFGDDPAAVARRWAEQGAEWLHVVNLDGAFSGQGRGQGQGQNSDLNLNLSLSLRGSRCHEKKNFKNKDGKNDLRPMSRVYRKQWSNTRRSDLKFTSNRSICPPKIARVVWWPPATVTRPSTPAPAILRLPLQRSEFTINNLVCSASVMIS